MDESADEAALLREVAPWLGDDESIVWIGRPDPRRFRWESAGIGCLGAIAFGAVLLPAVAIADVVGTRMHAPWLKGLTANILLLLLLRRLVGPHQGRVLCERTLYVVTTARAIVLNGFQHSIERNRLESTFVDRAFEIPSIRRRIVKRRRRGGSGDLIFDANEVSRENRSQGGFQFGFFGVPRVDEVDRILERVAVGGKDEKKDAPDPDFP
ncbi:hypothetical protein [Paludisphaera soli]|uniref:hypothetical protein n=1 Tax=Paludisphaera soli TaxID=2712865 RepID=UPI0013ED2474|nr:hypothetical protein [Paludisphaera soli]